MNTLKVFSEDRFLARIKIAVELTHTHGFDYALTFLLDHGPAIDRACHTIKYRMLHGWYNVDESDE